MTGNSAINFGTHRSCSQVKPTKVDGKSSKPICIRPADMIDRYPRARYTKKICDLDNIVDSITVVWCWFVLETERLCGGCNLRMEQTKQKKNDRHTAVMGGKFCFYCFHSCLPCFFVVKLNWIHPSPGRCIFRWCAWVVTSRPRAFWTECNTSPLFPMAAVCGAFRGDDFFTVTQWIISSVVPHSIQKQTKSRWNNGGRQSRFATDGDFFNRSDTWLWWLLAFHHLVQIQLNLFRFWLFLTVHWCVCVCVCMCNLVKVLHDTDTHTHRHRKTNSDVIFDCIR